jgi:hypothetical protein
MSFSVFSRKKAKSLTFRFKKHKLTLGWPALFNAPWNQAACF